MFENLVLETEERRTSPTEPKVDASPEVVAIVEQAWAEQQKSDEKALGHKVGPIGEDNVPSFHAQARTACAEHEPRLRYRKLTRLRDDKNPAKAYFTVTLWTAKDDAEEAQETEVETDSAKPATRRRTAK